MLNELIAENLKKYREKNKLSQQEMADLVGVHLSVYRRWEKNTREIKLSQLEQIAEATDLKFSELIDEGLEEIVAKNLQQDILDHLRRIEALLQNQKKVDQVPNDSNFTFERKSNIGLMADSNKGSKDDIILSPKENSERVINNLSNDPTTNDLLKELIQQNKQLIESNRRQETRLAAMEKNVRESEELAKEGLKMSRESARLTKENEQLAAISLLLTTGRISKREAEEQLKKAGIDIKRLGLE